MSNKTILVTGGAGFIGSNFVYLILEERPDWKVVCVDSLTYDTSYISEVYPGIHLSENSRNVSWS